MMSEHATYQLRCPQCGLTGKADWSEIAAPRSCAPGLEATRRLGSTLTGFVAGESPGRANLVFRPLPDLHEVRGSGRRPRPIIRHPCPFRDATFSRKVKERLEREGPVKVFPHTFPSLACILVCRISVA